MRLRRALGWLSGALFTATLAGVFVTASVAGVVLHADLPVTRRVLASTLSEFLSDYFQGTIEITNVTDFGRHGISVGRASVYDPFQNRVLLLENLKVRASLVGILEKVFSDEQKISLVIRHVRVERGDVRIIPHPRTQIPTIADAFTPRDTGPSEPSTRYIRVWLPTIEVGKAFGRGTVAGSPTLEADLRDTLGSVLVTPKGVAVDVSRFGLNLRGLGGADAKGLGSLHVRAPGPIWGNFDGYVSEVQLGAFVHYENDRLETRLDLPRVMPEQARAIWQDYPLFQEVSGRLEAVGPVEELDAKADLHVGPAKLKAKGVIRTEKELDVNIEAHTEKFDLRAVLPDAPETSLEAKAAMLAYSKDGQTTVEFNGFTQPGTVADIQVPAIDAHGSYDKVGLVSRATIHEPGMPAKLSFDMTPEGVINLKLDARRFQLDHPRIRPYFRASGLAKGSVNARIEEQSLTASFDADLTSLRYEDVALARGKLTGTAEGHINDLDHLEIDARLVGSDFVRQGMNFESIEVQAEGSVEQPRIEAKLENQGGQRVVGKGKVSTSGAPRVDDLALSVNHQGADLEVAAGQLESDANGIRVRDLVVVQDGKELRGNVVITPNLVQIEAKGRDIDLDAVSRAIGLKPGALSGRLTVDADLTSAKDIEQGQISFEINDTTLGEFESVSAKGVVSLNEGRVVGATEVDIKDLGRFGLELDGQLGGTARDIDAWKTMTGSSLVNVYAIDLASLQRFLDPSWGIEDLRGLATARVRLQRQDGTAPPSAFVDASTRNLQVVLEDDGDPSTVETIQGIDVQLGGAIDAISGTTSGSARLVDQHGTLVSTSGTASIDWNRLYFDPDDAPEVLADTNVEMVFVVPPRRLQHLPVQLRVAGVEGEVSGRLSMSGPIDDPVFNALMNVDKLQGTATSLTRPVRLTTRLNYAEQSGVLGGSVEAHQHSQRILWGSFQGQLNDSRANEGADPSVPAVTGSGRFQVEGLPLELLQPLSKAEIRGRLNGTVAISRERSEPDLNVDLDLEDGSIQNIPLGPGSVQLRSSASEVFAKASFGDTRSRLRAELRTRAEWVDSGLLIRDAMTLDLKSSRYDSVILLPFVDELFSELNGPLDANVKVVLQPPERTGAESKTGNQRWKAKFSGHARLHGGELEPADLGLKLTDADVNLVADREGRYNVVELTSVNASARSDEKNLTAKGKLYFDGVELSHGWASIGAKKVPFIVQGVRLADMTGQVATSFRAGEDHMSARVDLPSLHVELPRSSGRELIQLDDNEDIIVVQPLGPPGEEKEPGLPWHIDFALGKDVRVRSNALNLRLTGNPKMVIGENVDVSGKLYLPDGGRVLVAGKLFVIEHGFIQFDTDDFTNPHVSITSTWRTPSGIRITAYLRGTVQDPELTLESDPALPGGEDEIYALLFGGGSGQEGASSADPALAAGAAMLSSVLDNTELEGVELRAGEEKRTGSGQLATISESSTKSYAAAVQISDKVWFEGTYKSETGTLGSDGHSGFGGTVDWRFKEDWALRTELGELGAGVDLLWRYRY